MTFLNQAILLGLVGVAIPILIHLLHRREARVRDWGAMRFLLASLAARQRRILLEEMLLMALRCALIALLVLAAARPFIPADSRIPWTVVLPAILIGAMCAGIATVLWSYRRTALALLALAALLLLGAGAASAYEYITGRGHWTGGRDAKDLAVIIDGSMSMEVEVDGLSNFDRAVATARAAIEACRPGDAICLILAGPMPQAATAGPISDRGAVLDSLDELKPTSGPMGLLEALNFAVSALQQGQNATKRIVLITDGQRVGWDLESEARWQFLASALAQLHGQCEMFCRLLPLPEHTENRAVADVTFSRRIVGTDRPVGIRVKVVNAGTEPSRPVDVRLTVDRTALPSRRVERLEPAAAETIGFSYHFESPGRHVVSAQVVGADDLPPDDAAPRVIQVLENLPVLIVEGAPSSRPLDGAAAFIEVALAPGADGPEGNGNLIEPTVVPAAELIRMTDFTPYRVVILADVPRLPDGAAAALKQFVRDGGGLLIAPGERADPDFYNGWTSGENEPVAPALLIERTSDRDVTARPDLRSFNHPALALIADPAQSDADSLVVRDWWQMEANGSDPAVRVAAELDDGQPLLVERKLGKGYVLMTAVSLGRRDSNLPTLKSYVPLMHELVQFLAAPLMPQCNVRPASQVTVELPFPSGERPRARGQAQVVTPSGEERAAPISVGRTGWTAAFSGTGEPGLYRLTFPAELTGGDPLSVPFVVTRPPEESFLTPLQPEDLETASRFIPLTKVETDEDLVSLITGTVPGKEIWRQLALFALAVLVAEVALARWITVSRKTQSVQEVEFGEEDGPAAGPRTRLSRPVAARSGATGRGDAR